MSIWTQNWFAEIGRFFNILFADTEAEDRNMSHIKAQCERYRESARGDMEAMRSDWETFRDLFPPGP